MNTKFADKVCRVFFIFAFVLGTISVPGQSAKAQEYNPSIAVDSNQDAVALWGWITGSELTLTIDNPANGTTIDYTMSMILGPTSRAFYLGYSFDIQPGDLVTVTDGIISRQVMVTDVRILGANPDTDIVYGEADPSDTISVFAYNTCDFQGQVVTADQNGNWVADFTGICNLIGLTGIIATEMDENNGVTRFAFSVPLISVQLQNNRVDVVAWLSGNEITMNIDDPTNGVGTDYSDTKNASQANWSNNYVNITTFDLGTFETHPGDLVTMTDGITTKAAVVANLILGGGNAINDRVWGTADSGTVIQVLYQNDYNIFRNVITDAQGNWMADFSVAGDEPGEEAPFDIQPGNVMLVNQKDEDGDQTQIEWRMLNPTIVVRPLEDFVHGWGWPDGAWVTLTLDDPNTPQSPDYTKTNQASYSAPWQPQNTLVAFVNGARDIKAGDIVTMTDGITTKTHITTNLIVDQFDVNADTISGTAEPGSEVSNVNVCDDTGCSERTVTTDQSGHWVTDFGVPGDANHPETIDIRPNTEGIAIQNDEDGDATHIGWRVLNPYIHAGPNQGFVYAHDWPSGMVIHLIVARLGSVIYTSDATVGPCGDGNPGFAPCGPNDAYFDLGYFDLAITRFDLLPGDVITLTSEGITRSMIVSALQVTDINTSTDTLTGTADIGRDVNVGVCNGLNLMVTPDSSGHWTANFAPFDIAPGECGGATQDDGNGNYTQQGWVVDNPNFDVRANYDQVEAYQWGMGNTLTLKIDNPTTAENPDFTAAQTVTGTAPWDSSQTYVSFDLSGVYDIQVGDLVSVSNGSTTKTTVVTNLAFTTINIDANIVSGVSAPGSHVNIWACDGSNCINRHVNADQNGKWIADFAHSGSEGDEQNTFNIIPGTWIDSQQSDGDGDQTMFGENVPIDTTPPTITWVGDISNGHNYYFGLVPSEPTCTASDLSGVDGPCTVTGYSTTIGVHTLTATARDMAGNVATETRSYTVLPWTLKGFYQPVDMNDVYNTVKGGSTVPLKFEVFAGSTELTDVADIRSLTFAETTCNANAVTDEIELTATGGTSLRYADGQFIYNWKTPKNLGKCYRVTMTTIDSSSLAAYFKLK